MVDLTIEYKDKKNRFLGIDKRLKDGDEFYFGAWLIANIPEYSTGVGDVEFRLSHLGEKYDKPCYKKANFLSKANKYIAATEVPKKCAACKKKLVTCLCHDTCSECSQCEESRKIRHVIIDLGTMVMKIARAFKADAEYRYNDAGETESDGS